jgi:CBS-domain-containing membrane protein
MPRERRVDELMNPDVVVVAQTATVEEAVQRLSAHDISGAPVVDADGRLVGLLDDTDLLLSEARVHAPSMIELLGAHIPLPSSLHRFEDEIRHALAGAVTDLMTPDPPLLSPDDTAEDAATLLVEHTVSRLPVIDHERRVLGVVSRHDLVVAMGRDG